MSTASARSKWNKRGLSRLPTGQTTRAALRDLAAKAPVHARPPVLYILPTLHFPSSPQTGVAAGQEQLPSQTPVAGHSFCGVGCSRE